jgi:hypothetical protein
MWKELWSTLVPALLRVLRVAVAQIIGVIIDSTVGINVPYVGISIGAVLNGISKVLRDKYPSWAEWLPV